MKRPRCKCFTQRTAQGTLKNYTLIRTHTVCKKSHWVTCVSAVVWRGVLYREIDCRATKRGRTLDFQSNNWTKPHQLEKITIFGAPWAMKSVLDCAMFWKCHFPNTTDHDSDRMQDLSWQLTWCLQQQIRNVSIFTWITAMLRADVSEQQPDE